MRPVALRLFCIGWMATAAPLHAQNTENSLSPAQIVEKAKRDYGVGSNEDCPATSSGDAIVVCAKSKPPPRLDPVERFDPKPDMKSIAFDSQALPRPGGVGVTMRACFLQKCPKDLYFIDLKAIPEAPPGSDADKIGKGELRGR